MDNQDAGGSYVIDDTGARVLVERTKQPHEVEPPNTTQAPEGEQEPLAPLAPVAVIEPAQDDQQDRSKKPRN
jgi:hypothetical protein